MPIPHIKLSDGCINILLPSGPITIHPHTLNYRPISKLLDTDDLSSVQSLLAEKAPNGLFQAYLVDTDLVCNHISTTSVRTYSLLYALNYSSVNSGTFLGTYSSEQAIRDDFPEYFI